jgi:PKD repeat protein
MLRLFEMHTTHPFRAGRLVYRAAQADRLLLLLIVVSAVVVPPIAAARTARATTAAVAASFDWSVPSRLVDDADGSIRQFTTPTEINPSSWPVNFDACESTGAIVSFRWSIDGVPAGELSDCKEFSHEFPAEGTHHVSLTVADSQGNAATVEREVVVQDWLIVAVGDSYGSGEGNPDSAIPPDAFTTFNQAEADLNDAVDQLQTAQAQLSAALQQVADAQADFTAAMMQADTVSSDLSVLNQRIAERDAACRAFPYTGCAAATTRVTQATADLLSALTTLGLQALIDTTGAIQGELQNLVAAKQAALNVALAARDVAQQAVDTATAAREAAQAAADIALAKLRPVWRDTRCHRSANSGQVRAAVELEKADPRTSVTLVHLACSGATINDGLLGPYAGVEDPTPQDIAPQIDQAAALTAGRQIDALVISIGGNDVKFSSIIKSCIKEEPCYAAPFAPDPASQQVVNAICSPLAGGPAPIAPLLQHPFNRCADFFSSLPVGDAAQFFEGGIAELPSLYGKLQAAIRDELSNLPAGRVYLTEYPDATHDDAGNVCGYDPRTSLAAQLANLPGVTLPETLWANTVVEGGLRDAIRSAAAVNGWHVVDGVFDAFATHGYCADAHWLVRLTETFGIQGNVDGAVHPNFDGHTVYRDRIASFLTRDFYVNGNVGLPRVPVPCIGDCNGDGPVTVDELLKGINIGLGNQQLLTCPAFDANRDGQVTVDELVAAVNAALNGCAAG